MPPRGCFVTGTDTGVGKTIVAAAIAAALHDRGDHVAAFKPAVTGVEAEESSGAAGPEGSAGAVAEDWPPDHELLAAVTGARAQDVAPFTFAPAVSPHLAAELAGARLDFDALVAAGHAAAASAEVLVAEGVGGLLVPLTPEHSVRDLAVALGLPVVIAARPGLGTINHCLLTVEAARVAGLDVRAIVFTPWPAEPSVMEADNRATVRRLTGVEVLTLPALPGPAALAAAGAALPLDRLVDRLP